MNTTSIAQADTLGSASGRLPGLRTERLFFSGMAIAMTLVVFAGFAPSYYLKFQFGAPPELSALLHWHGVAFSLWMVLLVVQTSMIATGQVALHRRFGTAGVVLAACMMLLGGAVAITRAQQGILGPPGIPSLVFLAIPLATLIVFPALFGTAIYFRRRADFHKRLILLATMEVITAAVARLPGIVSAGPLAFFGMTDCFILALAVYDYRTRGRVHPATLWGGLFLIASQPLRLIISGTQAWQAFASWIAG